MRSLHEFPDEIFITENQPQAIACALAPGRTDVLIATVADVNGQAIRTMRRVPPGGPMQLVLDSTPENGPFPLPPLGLPFAMVAGGGPP